MKIVIDDKIPFIRETIDEIADEAQYIPGHEICAENVKDADALIVRTRTRCDKHLLEGSKVSFVATATIGSC
jgi:erythronate-4-phosphate dehydrogenase